MFNFIDTAQKGQQRQCITTKHVPGIFVFLYADDILILSPTVSKLQELLNVIECELQALDLTINSKKILLFTYRF